MHRFYLLIVYGSVEIKKIGPFRSADARDRRALAVRKTIDDATDAIFALDIVGGNVSVGEYSAMFFQQENGEEVPHAQAG